MRISVIGCGYLGAVHAAAMSSLGHEVVGVDVDPDKVARLSRGESPFYEPAFEDLLVEQLATGRLSFTTDLAKIEGASVHFVCVGTPQQRDSYAADMTYVEAAMRDLVQHLQPGDIVAGKSTVPVGSAERFARTISAAGATLVWNPEFLREGFAVEDTLRPDRLVYGVTPGQEGERARATLDEVYAEIVARGTPVLVVSYATAQLVKVAANSFLATKISFINAMAELCEAAGGDVNELADAIGHDDRIGRKFLNAGVGFGGGCLPKDIRAFMARADELGVRDTLEFLREIDVINVRRRAKVVDLAVQLCDGDVDGRRIAVLGAAFKPNSDDIRDAPALVIARELFDRGASVVVTDPKAVDNARRTCPQVEYVDSADEAALHADLVVLVTEWEEYRSLDPVAFGALVRRKVLIDGRNVLDDVAWRAAGWTVRGLGRALGGRQYTKA
ncbi:MAG TPA: UDP-glucose/GDP-mannose dehydrogenase family protein [Nocardioidaceae bacterium]|nr:UDP-glucose/GDP-mannose dehydrogenase family protein [Nocardioidaceae bacterium]